MRSLAATAPSAEPAFAGDFPHDHAFDGRLRRLAKLLGVGSARLTSLAADNVMTIASVGNITQNLAGLEARALAAEYPLVMADTAIVGARFYAGLQLPAASDRPPLLLSLFDARPRSRQMAERIVALAQDIFARATISRQNRTIQSQAGRIAALEAEDQLRRQLFDRASATARIGVWQCDLADNAIAWTDSVYDIFEVPHGAPITREQTLTLYTDASRLKMEAARAEAIRTCTDFGLDVEIITTTGKHRWMRLTGAVDSQDGVAKRIFGMKQDITDEKLMADRTRYLAEFDVMTGLANRSLFQARLIQLDAGYHTVGTLLLVDLDGFKQVNDTYGHAVGDECLKEAALRLSESCVGADLVARIGGDEFAVLLGPDIAPDAVKAQAASIVGTMGRPLTRLGQTLTLSASVGVASYRGGAPEDLFRQADTALYAAKAAGRNTFCVFAT
ncbi:diguanylate cyclase domain-containing protein [Devosia sp. A369]